jgi:molecular chaperone DnaK
MSVVGIDLGTTNTVVAAVRAGRVHVLADERGHRLLPSVVSFHPNGDVLVGHAAKARRAVDARNTIASVKRLIGRAWNSPELEKARQRFAFEMREGPGQGPLVVARGKEYTLPEISAFILKRARQIAEHALGETVERAVITVPAHFNELQRAATKVAGRVAGLEVLRILNEPTAAALAYGMGKTGSERVAVYDFGGGTFDATLLDLNGNVFEVLATAGDPFLGGDDVDDAIADRMAEAFLLRHRFDPRSDPQVFERLRQAAEQVKIELSKQEETTVQLREVAFGIGGAHLDLTFGLTRAELETMAEPFVERTFKVTQDALSLARLSPTSFDRTILVGGSTRIPLVRRRVEGFFGAAPMDRMNPDEVVAIGAAIQAAALTDAARRRSIPPPPGTSIPSATPPSIPPGASPDSSLPGTLSSLASLEAEDAPDDATRRLSVPKLVARARLSDLSEEDDAETQAMRRSSLPPPTSVPRVVPREVTPPRQPVPRTTQYGLGTPVPAPPPPAPPFASTSSSAPPPEARRSPRPSAPSFPGLAPEPPPARASSPSSPPGVLTTTQRMSSLPPPVGGPPAPPPPPMFPPRGAQYARPRPAILDPDETQDAPIAVPLRPSSAPLPAPTPDESAAWATPSPELVLYAGSSPAPMTAPIPRAASPLAATLSAGPAPVLVDVTPRALVVETVGGFCDTVIPRNAKIPCERTRAFATAHDRQTTVRVRVAQGEEARFEGNTYLGEVELSGLREAARGEVSVAVTFELDADGTLRVRASDPATGREAAAMLQLVGAARESQIIQMTKRVADQVFGPHHGA